MFVAAKNHREESKFHRVEPETHRAGTDPPFAIFWGPFAKAFLKSTFSDFISPLDFFKSTLKFLRSPLDFLKSLLDFFFSPLGGRGPRFFPSREESNTKISVYLPLSTTKYFCYHTAIQTFDLQLVVDDRYFWKNTLARPRAKHYYLCRCKSLVINWVSSNPCVCCNKNRENYALFAPVRDLCEKYYCDANTEEIIAFVRFVFKELRIIWNLLRNLHSSAKSACREAANLKFQTIRSQALPLAPMFSPWGGVRRGSGFIPLAKISICLPKRNPACWLFCHIYIALFCPCRINC